MSKKVLVVDDEKLIVKGIRFSLEQDGMDVDCAYDGEEALQKIKDKEYDIVVIFSCFDDKTYRIYQEVLRETEAGHGV